MTLTINFDCLPAFASPCYELSQADIGPSYFKVMHPYYLDGQEKLRWKNIAKYMNVPLLNRSTWRASELLAEIYDTVKTAKGTLVVVYRNDTTINTIEIGAFFCEHEDFHYGSERKPHWAYDIREPCPTAITHWDRLLNDGF